MEKILEIKNLKKYFYSEGKVIPAVDGIDIDVKKGDIVGIVGESGSGKSVTSLTTMRLIPGDVEDGTILFDNKNILELPEKQMRTIRGNDMAMIFQEPMTSLNPLLTIEDQIGEVSRTHMGFSKKQAKDHSLKLLKLVGIPRPEQVLEEYPHMLSGGMRQRVMISIAMAGNPKLLIADEPTTALDVTIQAQILEQLKNLSIEYDTSILLITHDMGVVAEMCDYVYVMYSGKIVEHTSSINLFSSPKHPYTQGLLKSIPSLDAEQDRLYSIQGKAPNPDEVLEGCPFAPRCEMAMEICSKTSPPLEEIEPGHFTKCWLYSEEEKQKRGVR